MNSIDLAFAPALEQAKLVHQREISPLELVELYLHRIEQLNGQLGSYVTVAAEQAIADAKAKTEAIAQSSDDLPPFFGVPISIKDLNAVAGLPCAYGVKVLKKRVATEDDGVVTRIKQAGFILLGKTATSEVGTLPYTEPDGFPPACNPWHLDYTPGGSSGGAAAAVAAGLCPIAQGSDGGGSIRGPASCCGLVGIKPSRGRVTHAPYGDRLSGISTSGPIGRTVADAAALLDAMSGYTTGDPYWLPDPEDSFLAATQAPPGRLRIAFATTIEPVGTADAPCQQAVLDTVQLLQALGHTVEPGCPEVGDLIEPFTIVWQSVLSEAGIPFIFLGKMNRWLLNRSRFQSSGKYLRAVSKMQRIARRIVTFFDTVDVLVLPTYLHTTIRVGEWDKLRPAQTMANIIGWVAPCPPFNATGQPAITIPAGFDPRGLPIGVQLIGRPAAETTLIALAAQLEAAKPWSQHRPPFATKK
ncbi:MAG: amidase [Stenomitos rutilans HA7619-LM2]|jgi:amidase|nr:amidase [Stenomitos rutilans HA7619-LM2]